MSEKLHASGNSSPALFCSRACCHRPTVGREYLLGSWNGPQRVTIGNTASSTPIAARDGIDSSVAIQIVTARTLPAMTRLGSRMRDDHHRSRGEGRGHNGVCLFIDDEHVFVERRRRRGCCSRMTMPLLFVEKPAEELTAYFTTTTTTTTTTTPSAPSLPKTITPVRTNKRTNDSYCSEKRIYCAELSALCLSIGMALSLSLSLSLDWLFLLAVAVYLSYCNNTICLSSVALLLLLLRRRVVFRSVLPRPRPLLLGHCCSRHCWTSLSSPSIVS
jgi:hypothetical protein